MADSERTIGPELPPHLRSKISQLDEEPESPPAIIGPTLPPQFRSNDIDEGSTAAGTSASDTTTTPQTIGPALPPHLRHLAEAGPSRQGPSGSEDSGSSSDSDGSADSECIGPRVELQGGDYDVRKEFEDRQRRAEEKDDQEPGRESWMTELPKDRTGVRFSGTEARTFLKRSGEDATLDDGWTDTPGQEKRAAPNAKDNAEKEQLLRAQRKRDAEIDEQLAEYNAKKRSKALIDLHQEEGKSGSKKSSHKKKDKSYEKKKKEKEKKRKREKKKDKKKKKSKDSEEEKPGRKPFNWEEDMRVSMVDTTRAKSMLDRTLLQSRFASGKAQKYL